MIVMQIASFAPAEAMSGLPLAATLASLSRNGTLLWTTPHLPPLPNWAWTAHLRHSAATPAHSMMQVVLQEFGSGLSGSGEAMRTAVTALMKMMSFQTLTSTFQLLCGQLSTLLSLLLVLCALVAAATFAVVVVVAGIKYKLTLFWRAVTGLFRMPRRVFRYFKKDGVLVVVWDHIFFPLTVVDVLLNTEGNKVDAPEPKHLPADNSRGKEMATGVPLVPLDKAPRFVASVLTRAGDSYKQMGVISALNHKRLGRVLVTAKHVWDASRFPDEEGDDQLVLGKRFDGEWRTLIARPKIVAYSNKLDVVLLKVGDGVYSSLALRAESIVPFTKNTFLNVLSPGADGYDYNVSSSTAEVARAFELRYLASTVAGSSGSPLYNSKGVFGIHTGYEKDADSGLFYNIGTVLEDMQKVRATKPVYGKETDWKRDYPTYQWLDPEDRTPRDSRDSVDWEEEGRYYLYRRYGVRLAGYNEDGAIYRELTPEERAREDREFHRQFLEKFYENGPMAVEETPAKVGHSTTTTGEVDTAEFAGEAVNGSLGSRSSDPGSSERQQKSEDASLRMSALKEKYLAVCSRSVEGCSPSEVTQDRRDSVPASLRQPSTRMGKDSDNGDSPIGVLEQSTSPSNSKPDEQPEQKAPGVQPKKKKKRSSKKSSKSTQKVEPLPQENSPEAIKAALDFYRRFQELMKA